MQSNDDDIFDAEDAEELFLELRRLQSKTKCTEATLFEIIQTFSKYHNLEAPTKADLKRVDRKMQNLAGATYLELHGCKKSLTACGKFVFEPKDKRERCPLCGAERFNANGKPNEVRFRLMFVDVDVFARSNHLLSSHTQRVFYFPIEPKLRALMKTQEYFDLIQHEFERPRNPEYITDVYDSPAWQKFLGEVKYPNDRIALQMCIDAIPAFAADTYSLKPLALMNWSLSPTIRGKTEFMLLMMLLPATLKDGQKKYYDFAAGFELNRLSSKGVGGVKIKIFGTSMDTKGREELLGMQACQAYQSCWVCTHSWSPGRLVRRRQCIFDGYRAFLAPGSRARRRTFKFKGFTYQYRWVSVYSVLFYVVLACMLLLLILTHPLSYVIIQVC